MLNNSIYVIAFPITIAIKYLITTLAVQYSPFVLTGLNLSSVNLNLITDLLLPANSCASDFAGLNGVLII